MNWKFWQTKKVEDVKHALIFDVEFDIEGRNVISIERFYDETLITYVWNGKLEEGYYQTTLEQHNNFVNRFRAKLKGNQK